MITESTKFGHKSFAKFANIAEVDMIITVRGLFAASAKSLKKSKIEFRAH